jgi:hypothetical protein
VKKGMVSIKICAYVSEETNIFFAMKSSFAPVLAFFQQPIAIKNYLCKLAKVL